MASFASAPALAPGEPEERLRTLQDRAQLAGLVDRFVHGLDSPARPAEDWYRSLLTEDVRLTLPNGSHQGITGLPAFMAEPRTKWAATQHYATNCLVDIDGDQASVRANVHAVHVPHDRSAPLFTGGAHYDVRAERTGEGWRVAQLDVTVLWTAEARRG
ncbi:nuclear transport factor 2 family protein [Streptomyces sp. MB09-02B]|uniref:nuclear transport factor 2 family protein n=1 Tax=Streptomyces sp. MB09-02B TaxID=3028667 RepID=UPI0029ADB6D5|nr:nuclear transport factor 2 family protein [Streptomyces sp. MB09-02B]MDX3642271.1 nuclear transport factor 2 family protein [Streptomyces sp. MB09-02B]